MQVGIYKSNKLIKIYKSNEQTSEALPKIFDEIIKYSTCRSIYFAKGPGSFMAIKVTYIFLRALSIVKDIDVFATDGFYFNNNNPIKAMSNLYFVKENSKIITKIMKDEVISEFQLPERIIEDDFTKDIAPLYILPAV